MLVFEHRAKPRGILAVVIRDPLRAAITRQELEEQGNPK